MCQQGSKELGHEEELSIRVDFLGLRDANSKHASFHRGGRVFRRETKID